MKKTVEYEFKTLVLDVSTPLAKEEGEEILNRLYKESWEPYRTQSVRKYGTIVFTLRRHKEDWR